MAIRKQSWFHVSRTDPTEILREHAHAAPLWLTEQKGDRLATQ
jgi:hypothetical protein